MKNGLFQEDGGLVYYKNDKPYHAGVVEVDGAIYYISKKGQAVKGEYVVHGEMTNGILKRGTYTFGEDYKLVAGSFVAPKRRKRKKKFKLRIKNKKMVFIVGMAAALLLIATVFVCQEFLLQSAGNRTEQPQSTSQSKVVLPNFDEDVLLCSPVAKKVYDNQLEMAEAVKSGDPYRPFLFKYGIPSDGKLYLSEHEDMSAPKVYTLSAEERQLRIDNLKTGTQYYYQVSVDGETYDGSFKTAAATRFVYMPGVENARDIGGYQNLDGKTVKQGILIRGTELDGVVNTKFFLKDPAVAQEDFDFVYDMDLRDYAVYQGDLISRLGNDVDHKFYHSPQYLQIFQESWQESIRQQFADLADPNKYPMYFHCTWGQDRTGTIIFLLQGVLNMSQEDMIREYRLTGFANSDMVQWNYMETLVHEFQAYEGNTLQEQIVTFLLEDVGVTQAEIDSIRSIFLD